MSFSSRSPLSAQEALALITSCSSADRWGEYDELRTLN
jgi:hypothetical protein